MSVAALPDQADGRGRRDDLTRTPPQDVAAEQSVLGAMLLSKDAIADVVEVLTGADFYKPAHELVYEAILDLYSRGEPADAVTVVNELARGGTIARVGGAPYVHTLIAMVPTAANAGYYAQIVRERSVLRRLVTAGTRIVQMGYAADGGDADDIVDRAQAEIYGVTERRASEDYLPLSEIMEGALDEIEAIGSRGGQMVGVPTGFNDLDQLTNGLHPGQMIVVAARPAVGKSTLGLDVARSAAIRNQLATVLFSLEMSRNEITMRLLSAEARVPLHHMRSGTMNDDDWTRLARKMGEVSSAPLFIDDSPNMTMMEIRAKCRRLKQRHDLKLVVIDYLQLMSSGKRVESRQQEVSEFSRAIKLLAKELEVPVIAISQLNRGSEQRTDKRPQMSDLRESGCLPASTRVLRADTGAPTTLGELHASGERDVPVWSLDDSLRYVRRPLTHVFSTGVRSVFRLRLASGREVRATANHPFLTQAGWRRLDELGPGTRVAAPRHVPAPLAAVAGCSDAQVVLLAHLLAGGRTTRRGAVYSSFDGCNLAAVADAARALGLPVRRRAHLDARAGTVTVLMSRATSRRHWLGRSGRPAVPAEVFALPKAQIALFLRHAWAAAGSTGVQPGPVGGPRRVDIVARAASRRLLDDLALLMLRFGISGDVRSQAGGWGLAIVEPEDQRRFLREIGLHGSRAAQTGMLLALVRHRDGLPPVDSVPTPLWERLREVMRERADADRVIDLREPRRAHAGPVVPVVPAAPAAPAVPAAPAAPAVPTAVRRAVAAARPGATRLAAVARVFDEADLAVTALNDVLWDEVVSVEPAGAEEVFDATVIGTHNFIADGVAVHNSIEQDADMVILLHREELYEKESPRAGEADFIVAKHRNGPTATLTVAFQGHYSRFVDMAQM